jgi:error-prone DNA polymerase
MIYAELVCASNFSFLRGASPAGDLVATALALGHAGLGIADRNTLAGVVRAFRALRDLREEENADLQARAQKFKLALGARLAFVDGAPDIVVYPANRAGWGRLCRLLTTGNLRAKKGACALTLDDLLADPADFLLILAPDEEERLASVLPRVMRAARGSVWLAARMARAGDDRRRLAGLKALAKAHGAPLLAVRAEGPGQSAWRAAARRQ